MQLTIFTILISTLFMGNNLMPLSGNLLGNQILNLLNSPSTIFVATTDQDPEEPPIVPTP